MKKKVYYSFMLMVMLLLASTGRADFQYTLSACAIFRDDAPFLKEWIEYHLLLGVQHFYLCNHNSEDHYRAVVEPYIRTGVVELEEIYNDPLINIVDFDVIQCSFYESCIRKTKGTSQWLAIIDTDEYIVPIHDGNLPDLLERYQDCAGLAVNWHMFGTSNIEKISPHELMIEKFICCSPIIHEKNFHIKSIVQPLFVTSIPSPHFAHFYPPYQNVNTDRVPFSGPFSPYIQVSEVKINHYWFRGGEYYFWHYKYPRQVLWNYPLDQLFKEKEEFNSSQDEAIQRFVPALKKRMRLT